MSIRDSVEHSALGTVTGPDIMVHLRAIVGEVLQKVAERQLLLMTDQAHILGQKKQELSP